MSMQIFARTTALLLFLAWATDSSAAPQTSDAATPAQSKRVVAGKSKPKKTQEVEKPSVMFPKATRVEPDNANEAKHLKPRNALVKAYNEKAYEQAATLAKQYAQLPGLKAGDIALAAQIELFSRRALKAPNRELITLTQTALNTGALDNNTHYSLMRELAYRWFDEAEYGKSAETASTFMRETGLRDPDLLAVKANAHFRQKQLPDAEADMKEAITAKGEAVDQTWLAMMVRILADQGKKEESQSYAKRLQTTAGQQGLLDQAAVMLDAGDIPKAATLVDEARKVGQVKTARDYEVAYRTYAKAKNRDADLAEVVSEGLANGQIKESFNILSILAQAHYYANDLDKAIAVWQRAAPMAKDGNTYLNLAIGLADAERYDEAQAAAQMALKKGLKNPQEARDVLRRIEASR